jgi:hypothetical protein
MSATVTFNLVSQQQQQHSQKPDEDDDDASAQSEPSQSSSSLRLAWSQTQAPLGDQQASDPPTDEDAEDDDDEEEDEGQSLNMMPTGSVRSSQGARPSQEPVTASGAALLPLSEQVRYARR